MSTAKKSTAKKSTAKKSTAKKSMAKKSTAKKSTAKRINFVFRTNTLFRINTGETCLVLYSHSGGITWRQDLALAIEKARPRWTDDSYALRIIIDQLTKDGRDSENGFGIFLCPADEIAILDFPVVINVQEQQVSDIETDYSWNWDSFCDHHLREIPNYLDVVPQNE